MQPDPQFNFHELDRLDAATDSAIAACDGDLRSTIRSLIVANEYLEYEFRDLLGVISATREKDSEASAITYFVALPFVMLNGAIAPGVAEECRTPAQALRRAETLSTIPGNTGAVAFRRTGNLVTGIFSDAEVIKSFGDVSSELTKRQGGLSFDDVPDWYD